MGGTDRLAAGGGPGLRPPHPDYAAASLPSLPDGAAHPSTVTGALDDDVDPGMGNVPEPEVLKPLGVFSGVCPMLLLGPHQALEIRLDRIGWLRPAGRFGSGRLGRIPPGAGAVHDILGARVSAPLGGPRGGTAHGLARDGVRHAVGEGKRLGGRVISEPELATATQQQRRGNRDKQGGQRPPGGGEFHFQKPWPESLLDARLTILRLAAGPTAPDGRASMRIRTTLALCLAAACAPAVTPARPGYDLIIRGGTVYDGSGQPPFVGDIGIAGDRISALGDLSGSSAGREVDARGLAVSPGFINMLSWANVALIHDGRSQGNIRQGVTLEIFGEGSSPGPLNDEMRRRSLDSQGEIKYEIPWTTLGGYLEHLEPRGISPNGASFVWAPTVRIHELGQVNRAPTPEALARMEGLVEAAMREGALGVGSSLIYAPADYARTDELIALARAAGRHGGMYISHVRDEGGGLLVAVDELLTIAREARVPAEIYHLKASGRANWAKLDSVIAKVDSARAAGMRITADMYTYPASSTGLDATMPTWVQEGGYDAWAARLRDPATRARVAAEMRGEGSSYDNAFANAGGPGGILLVSFREDSLRYLVGRTLEDVSRMRGTPPEETAMDLVIQNGGDVGSIYFTMSEDNVRKKIGLPWVSFGSDAGSYATEGVFLNSGTHPRAYGNFARLLGRYVREEKIIPLEEAVRRLTLLPATNIGIRDRGALRPGYMADIVIFDPGTIIDHATFEK